MILIIHVTNMVRIIARLDVKPPYVVKPIQFEGLRKIGDPKELSQKYYNQGADEILYIDIVSSLYQREILYSNIFDASQDIFVPYAAGGGVRTVNDFVEMLHHGVDKVVINTNAILNPNVIKEAVEICGSQAVVVHIEAKKWDDHWECYTDCGRIPTSVDVFEWAKAVEMLGAGEIIVSSVDNDGTKKGFDIDLIKKMSKLVNIPLIAASGAGSLEDIKKVIIEGKPDAVAIASLLHYNSYSISEIKNYLSSEGIEVML